MISFGRLPHFRAMGTTRAARPGGRSECWAWTGNSRTKAVQCLPSRVSCDSRGRDNPGKTSRNRSLRRDLSFLRLGRRASSAAGRSRSSSRRPTSSIKGTESSSSSRTGFSTISAVIMSLSSSLLSASTLTICTSPGVRICRCETFRFSLGWSKNHKSSLVVRFLAT